MNDFAIFIKNKNGQAFGSTGQHMLKHVPPMEGSGNRWQFQLPEDMLLEVIIVDKPKSTLAILAGHYREVFKAYIRRIGISLSHV